MNDTIHSTEYPELAYQQQGERNWRFIDTATGNAIGKSYPTCAALRMNIRRQAIAFGCQQDDIHPALLAASNEFHAARAENERIKTINAALLAACKRILTDAENFDCTIGRDRANVLRSAISLAEGAPKP